jgi:lipid-binding SYLF domain-containing protein
MRRLTAFLVLTLSATLAFADAKTDSAKRLESAGWVLKEIMAVPEKGIPQEVFDGAKCLIVVPNMKKGGLGIGGKHGRGVATCKTAKGWSAPAFVSIGGGSVGLQIGFSTVDLVLVFMNDKAMQSLLTNKFEIGADASAAAGPTGRHARAGTDWKLDTGILTYSRSKGAFAGVSLEGAKIQQDEDSTVATYGKMIDQKETLSGGTPAPPAAEPFLKAVQDAATTAGK